MLGLRRVDDVNVRGPNTMIHDNVTNSVPVWGYALVKPREAHDTDDLARRAKLAGIKLPDSTIKDMMLCQTTATLVRFGGNCFEDLNGHKPTPGCGVIINKFEGFCMSDAVHRMVTDTSILATVDEGVARPLWGNVLVKPDDITETDEVLANAKRAGLHVVDVERDHLQRGQVAGTVVSLGGNAFEKWVGDIPKPGDRVLFSKGAGFVLDDCISRIIADTDIMAILK